MIDVFISYAREDNSVEQGLYQSLRKHGYRPWFDKQNLIPGQDWSKTIELAVRRSDVRIFLCSPRSVNKRGFFQREIRIALAEAQSLLEQDISIIPYIVEDCEVPDSLSKYQWVDGRESNSERELLRALAFAADRRGAFARVGDAPVVVDFEDASRSEKEGAFLYSYVVPTVRFPGDLDLDRTINGLIFANTHNSIMQFRRSVVDDDRSNILEVPNEFHTEVAIEFLNRSFLSMTSSTWWYSGGAHANSFRSAISVSVEDRTLFRAFELETRKNLLS